MWRDGLLGERVMLHEAIASIRGGTLGPAALVGTTPASPSAAQGVGGYVTMPLVNRADAQLLDYLGIAISTLDATNLADWRGRTTRMKLVEQDVDASKLSITAKILMPSLDRAFQTRYRLVTDRHLAAVALACRLYMIDHDGALPPSLDALIPAYLPHVPSDAIDGKPLRYDAKRAIVWSVGENGVDDGGDETTRRPQDAGNRWTMKDAVVHLTPTTRPATMPSE